METDKTNIQRDTSIALCGKPIFTLNFIFHTAIRVIVAELSIQPSYERYGFGATKARELK
jgi:hypothetical protein